MNQILNALAKNISEIDKKYLCRIKTILDVATDEERTDALIKEEVDYVLSKYKRFKTDNSLLAHIEQLINWWIRDTSEVLNAYQTQIEMEMEQKK